MFKSAYTLQLDDVESTVDGTSSKKSQYGIARECLPLDVRFSLLLELNEERRVNYSFAFSF